MTECYACTFIAKDVEDDHFIEGCGPDSRRCVLYERCDITAETFPDLMKRIGERYGMEIGDLFIPEGETEIETVGFNRLESGSSDHPSEREMSRWRKGEITLYLADYTFHVEKRAVMAVSVDEIKASLAESGVSVHG